MNAQTRSFTDRSRPWRILVAALGGLWAAVTLPLPATAFGIPQWRWILELAPYDGARQWAGDPYVVFGALAGVSFLALGLALLPDLHRAGWGGQTMGWLIVAGAPLTALSYLNTPTTAPLHFIWGWEFYVLVAIAVSGFLAAATAGPRWGMGARTLLGMTLLILLVGTLLLSYWPHGTLVALAVEAVAVIAAAPRDVAFTTGTDAAGSQAARSTPA